MHSTGEHSGSSPILAEPGGAGLIQGLLPEPEVFVERFRFGNAPTGSEHRSGVFPKTKREQEGSLASSQHNFVLFFEEQLYGESVDAAAPG